MHFMVRRMPVSSRYGQERAASQQVVENRSNAADRKAENNALDVEAAPAREVKEARRVPVSGTKSGSVRPSGAVIRLAHIIALRWRGNATYAASHGTRNALDHTSQTYWSGITPVIRGMIEVT
jgi:hypothetical protein